MLYRKQDIRDKSYISNQILSSQQKFIVFIVVQNNIKSMIFFIL